MTQASQLLDALNDDYVRLHTRKEDAFWTSYMGLEADAAAARAELDRRDIEVNRFLQDPANLQRVRGALASATDLSAEEKVALEGWQRTFEAHVIESAEARKLSEEIIEAEGALARERNGMNLGYEDPEKGFTAASSVKLAILIQADTDERRRKAAWEGLRSIEPFLLEKGFLELVRMRNRLGRMLGGEDYYDGRVRRVEGLSKKEIFGYLDDLESKTRAAARRNVDELKDRVGAARVTPWNVRYLTAGDVTREKDPYFAFGKSLERWARSFTALGIRYQGARLVLDLLDRKGKHENGFMHGPEIAWRRRGELRPARIQFTANAIPGMVGSGFDATKTFFHEGGHAAHFANIDMPAPCFGQEFAPSSVAFAEVQSMFLDSILGDADWQVRYATGPDGAPMPWSLIEKGIRATQPFAAWSARALMAVCYGEKAVYEIPDRDLTAARVLSVLREAERRLLFLDQGSNRPILAVPHLLGGESSAYYHGYVLAMMGVHQTRNHFLARDGHLTDNSKIGPDLRRHYWQPGNSRRFTDFIESMTGKRLSADAYSEQVNRTVDQALADAKRSVDAAAARPPFRGKIELEAAIRVAHGNETVAEMGPRDDFGPLAARFESWVDELAAASSSK